MATPRARAAGSARSRFDCSHCGAVFVRREHRDRHVLAHSGVKAHRCHICLKSFSRADTLSRHISNHDGVADTTRSPRRCLQACVPCAQRKQRCDGARPCRRCVTSQQACRYQDQTLPLEDAPEEPSAGWSDNDVNPDNNHNDNVHMPSFDWLPTLASNNFRTGVDWGLMDFPFIFDSALTPGSALAEPTHVNAMLDDNQHSSTQQFCLQQGNMQGTEELPPPPPPPPPLFGFPYCGSHTLDEAESEVFGHILGIPDVTYHSLQQFYTAQVSCSAAAATVPSSASPLQSSDLPPKRLFEIFVDLYFEYFDHQFPCVHPTSLEDTGAEDIGEEEGADGARRRPLSWKLLLIVAFIGSQYSAIENIRAYQVAMRELVRRAMEGDRVLDLSQLDVSDVQATFLHHIYLMSSGSKRDKTLLQYRRNVLITMCRHLSTGPPPRSSLDTPLRTSFRPLEERWAMWLHEEEQVRLICCVHIMESLGLIFLDLPVLFSLTELVQRVPSPWKAWQCRDAYTWESGTIAVSSPSAKHQDPFLTKLSLLQLYIDERCLQNHVETSQLVRAHFSSYLGIGGVGQGRHHNTTSSSSSSRNDRSNNEEPGALIATSLPENFRGHNSHLDTLMDVLLVHDDKNNHTLAGTTIATMATVTAAGHSQQDTLTHILAILRHVPLQVLHAATGYQADADQISRAKARFRNLVFHRGTAGGSGGGGETASARRSMWHAARVFAILRARTRFTCYDMFCLCVAICYLLCFCEGIAAAEEEGDTSQQHQHQHSQQQPSKQQKRAIVRLDQLPDRASIMAYIDGTTVPPDHHPLLHLTGVGILNRPDMPRRLFNDVCNTYESQIAWKAMCHNFAGAYKQMRSGQHPTPLADDT